MRLRPFAKQYPLGLFYRQLAMLLSYENSIVDAMAIIEEEIDQKDIKKMNKRIREDSKDNIPIYKTLSEFPYFFPCCFFSYLFFAKAQLPHFCCSLWECSAGFEAEFVFMALLPDLLALKSS